MDTNEILRRTLEQTKKLTADADAIKRKSLADAEAIKNKSLADAEAIKKKSLADAEAIIGEAVKMDPRKLAQEPTPPKREARNDTGKYIYSIFHTTLSLVSIYLSYRCNGCFEWTSFLAALCCPYLYLIYILAFKGSCLNDSFVAPVCGQSIVYVQAPPVLSRD